MFSMKLYYDTLAPNARAEQICAQHTICFCESGSAVVNGEAIAPIPVADWANGIKGDTVYCIDSVVMQAGPEGAVIWRFELDRDEAVHIAQGEGVDSILKKVRKPQMFALVPNTTWTLTLDSVMNFLGTTGLHSTHGSGIRVLMEGEVSVRSRMGDNGDCSKKGDTWYEEGSYPLVTTTPDDVPASFLRFIIMPYEYMEFHDSGNWLEGKGGLKPSKVKNAWRLLSQQLVTLH